MSTAYFILSWTLMIVAGLASIGAMLDRNVDESQIALVFIASGIFAIAAVLA